MPVLQFSPMEQSKLYYCSVKILIFAVNYEGRSINKLQNGAIPSVLNIGKIRNIRFVGNLILHTQIIFFMMTSLL